MAKEELAWAAGFFDGEGWSTTGRRAGGATYFQLAIQQKDRRVLDRFKKAVGFGNVNGPYKNSPFRNAKSVESYRFVWQVNGAKTCQVVNVLWPFLSQAKKDQISTNMFKLEGMEV